uniref:Uncharacterized protein n=1 Tax=Rhizophora mucronata TaxID=61149 RepID=A0A2P2QFR3_RHIMU
MKLHHPPSAISCSFLYTFYNKIRQQ